MKKVIMTRGLPASGKSTWSKEQLRNKPNSMKRINKDDLRAMLDDNIHSQDTEKFVLSVRDTLILQALAQGKHVIVDDTNLAPKHFNRISELVKGKAIVEIQDFTHVPVSECIRRDSLRAKPVGAKVILDMYNQFLKPPVPKIEYDRSLPSAIICDLDGTLALLNGRDPYDASSCEQDAVNEPVLRTILTVKTDHVLFVSGREDKYRNQTIAFLNNKCGINFGSRFVGLYMRQSGDTRKDSIIKQEIYDAHIKGKYNVDFVLDDRNQVVDFWRSIGLTCFQVADGDF